MTISYPLDLPASANIATFDITMTDATAISESPFTFQQDVHSWGGAKWGGTMTLPNMEDLDAADWEGWLAGLRGTYGTFLAGDSSRASPFGTATAGTITGSADSYTVSVAMLGSLSRGDYFQVGTGLDARLYMVAETQSGSGSLKIWPPLRQQASDTSIVLKNPKGLFRLATRQRGWSIRGGGWRSISIPIMEAV